MTSRADRSRYYPKLAGQLERYLFDQLNDFEDGRRSDPSMDAIVPQLSAQDMRDLAAFFASIRPRSSQFKPNSEKAARGNAKAAKVGGAGCRSGTGNLAMKESVPHRRPASRLRGETTAGLQVRTPD